MRRLVPIVALALMPVLAGCEIFVVGAAVTLTSMAFSDGEGRKTYAHPYDQVVPIAEDASATLNLVSVEIDRGRRKTVITGKNVDGEKVKIRVYSREKGKKAEVTVRAGLLGDYLSTALVFDAINEELGLPPESQGLRREVPH